MGTRSLSQR